MARYQLSQASVDEGIQAHEAGLVAQVLGWILLGMAGIVGVFVFSAFRDGDSVWPTYTGVMALIGAVLVAAGWWFHRSAD